MTIWEQIIEQGKQEGIKNIAVRLIKMGLPTDTILEATGLSEEELKQLQQS